MKTSRVTPEVEQRFAQFAESAVGQMAKISIRGSAGAIGRSQEYFRLEGDTVEQRRLTTEEKAQLAPIAASAIEAKYGRAFKMSADAIITELAKAPVNESVADLLSREGINPVSLSSSHLSWNKKAVYHLNEIALARESIRARAEAPPAPAKVVLPQNSKRKTAELALGELRNLETFRDLVLTHYVVRSGDTPPDVLETDMNLRLEEVMERSINTGLLDDRGRIADPKVRHGFWKALSGMGVMLRSGPEEFTMPEAHGGVYGSRASMTDVYDTVNNYMLPAMQNYLQQLGAQVETRANA